MHKLIVYISLTQVRNEKARKYLGEMRKKSLVPFTQKFPNADPSALRLLQRLLAFDPKDRPTATEVRTCSFLSLVQKSSLFIYLSSLCGGDCYLTGAG